MTDLTEQWKKGELPSGWYYYGIHNETDVIGCDKLKMYRNRRDIKDDIEVLAEVPDYVEWQNMVNCACEEHEANHRLWEENAQLKEKIERLEKRYDRAKWWLNEIVKNHRFTPISTAEKALKDLKELEK